MDGGQWRMVKDGDIGQWRTVFFRTVTATVESGQWTVDSGQWTVNSEQ